MQIECNIDTNNKYIFLTLKDDNIIIKTLKCKQNYFCENISSMIVDLLKSSGLNVNDITFLANFPKDKFSTTYRIFQSFAIGAKILY